MSAFYNAGEVKTRPGVYRRIVNIGKITIKPSTHTPVVPDVPPAPPPEEDTANLSVSYDEGTGAVTLTGSGLQVVYDEETGTVTVMAAGLTVDYDDETDTVTIGG